MSRTLTRVSAAAAFALVLAMVAGSHPHFRKTVIAKMPELEVRLDYTTLPWNAEHTSQVKDGFIFSCGFATLELDKPAKQGAREIPAGKYQLRARAKDLDNWTFLLIPAPADRNAKPDLTKAVEMTTRTLKGRPIHDHLVVDVSAGHGETDNKAVVVLAWGDRQLEGVLADFAMPK
jgi:hypothetical protein